MEQEQWLNGFDDGSFEDHFQEFPLLSSHSLFFMIWGGGEGTEKLP